MNHIEEVVGGWHAVNLVGPWPVDGDSYAGPRVVQRVATS